MAGLLRRLFGRPTPAQPAGAGAPSGIEAAADPGWQHLPPAPSALPHPSLTVQTSAFEGSLATRRSPLFLEPLGHRVSGDGPSGSVEGIASLVPPAPATTGMTVQTFAPRPPSARDLRSATFASGTAETAPAGAGPAVVSAGEAPLSPPLLPPPDATSETEPRTAPAVHPADPIRAEPAPSLTQAPQPDLPRAFLHVVSDGVTWPAPSPAPDAAEGSGPAHGDSPLLSAPPASAVDTSVRFAGTDPPDAGVSTPVAAPVQRSTLAVAGEGSGPSPATPNIGDPPLPQAPRVQRLGLGPPIRSGQHSEPPPPAAAPAVVQRRADAWAEPAPIAGPAAVPTVARATSAQPTAKAPRVPPADAALPLGPPSSLVGEPGAVVGVATEDRRTEGSTPGIDDTAPLVGTTAPGVFHHETPVGDGPPPAGEAAAAPPALRVQRAASGAPQAPSGDRAPSDGAPATPADDRAAPTLGSGGESEGPVMSSFSASVAHESAGVGTSALPAEVATPSARRALPFVGSDAGSDLAPLSSASPPVTVGPVGGSSDAAPSPPSPSAPLPLQRQTPNSAVPPPLSTSMPARSDAGPHVAPESSAAAPVTVGLVGGRPGAVASPPPAPLAFPAVQRGTETGPEDPTEPFPPTVGGQTGGSQRTRVGGSPGSVDGADVPLVSAYPLLPTSSVPLARGRPMVARSYVDQPAPPVVNPGQAASASPPMGTFATVGAAPAPPPRTAFAGRPAEGVFPSGPWPARPAASPVVQPVSAQAPPTTDAGPRPLRLAAGMTGPTMAATAPVSVAGVEDRAEPGLELGIQRIAAGQTGPVIERRAPELTLVAPVPPAPPTQVPAGPVPAAVQRADEPAPPSPPSPPPPGPSGGGPAPGAAATAAGGAPAAGGQNLDELSRQLYDRIRDRLRAELRLDRERAGSVSDLIG